MSRVFARGFTLIELMITLAILALLASVAVPYGQLLQQRQKEAELQRALREIRGAIDSYRQMVREGRISAAADSTGYPPNLEVLWKGVPDATKPDASKLYFIRRLPRDPFYPDQTVDPSQTWGLRSYASPPEAPAAGADVYDIYSLSSQNGLNGTPYRSW